MKGNVITGVVIQMVTFNNAATIEACARSVLKQRYKNFEFIVIDNASTDSTREILKRLGVHTLPQDRNLGYAQGHNIGLRYSRSRYVLTLNPDVVIRADFVEQLVAALDKAPSGVGSAQALLYRVEQLALSSDRVDSAGLYMSIFRRQNLRLAGMSLRGDRVSHARIFGPDGAAAFYRRAMLDDIAIDGECFDEDFFMHKEDVDVCWRAQLRGWTSLFVPRAVGYHIRTFRPGQRKHVQQLVRMLAVRNRYYLMIKNELPLLFLRDFFWIAFYEAGIFLYLLLFERPSLKAYGEVFLNAKRMLRKRKIIQRSRKAGVGHMSQWFRWRPL